MSVFLYMTCVALSPSSSTALFKDKSCAISVRSTPKGYFSGSAMVPVQSCTYAKAAHQISFSPKFAAIMCRRCCFAKWQRDCAGKRFDLLAK